MRLCDLVVDDGLPSDQEAILRIFRARGGALTKEWAVLPGSSIFVVRDLDQVVAFAIVRVDMVRRQYVVDNLECERGEHHATLRGVQAMRVFGGWLRERVHGAGGGSIYSCVGADNRAHEEALKKVGYVDRVHVLELKVEGE